MKKKILILFLALLLSVTVSTAWILNFSEIPPSRYLVLDAQRLASFENGENLGKLTYPKVQDLDAVTMQLLDVNNQVASDNLVMTEMNPGDSLNFILRFANAGTEQTVKLYLTGIEVTSLRNGAEDILDSIYLMLSAGEGFDSEHQGPDFLFVPISSLIDPELDATSALILKQFRIPPTEEGKYVELNGRLWFDVNAENLEDIRFSIGNFAIGL